MRNRQQCASDVRDYHFSLLSDQLNPSFELKGDERARAAILLSTVAVVRKLFMFATTLVARVTFRFIEKPSRRWIRRSCGVAES